MNSNIFWSINGIILALVFFLIPKIQAEIGLKSIIVETDLKPVFTTEKFLPVQHDVSWQTLFLKNPFISQTEMEINKKIISNTNLSIISSKQKNIPMAVIIENHGTARPQQAGLTEANIVYEALAEGGITRFLVIFLNSTPKRVGPVRSVRPYFVDFASEYTDAIVHAGGSAAALQKLYQLVSKKILVDFDEGNPALFRDFTYPKPHNLFVNLVDVSATFVETGLKSVSTGTDINPVVLPFITKEKNDSIDNQAESGTVINLNFSRSTYEVKYKYDFLEKKYLRWNGGYKHLDAISGKQIAPRNVIIQITDYYLADDAGHLELTTYGEGPIFIFSDGWMRKGKWQKKVSENTKFFDANGNQLILPTGQTWIEVINVAGFET